MSPHEARTSWLYVGTHRRAQRADAEDIAFGIYGYEQAGTGLRQIGMTETPQPGWIEIHPAGHVLYAVNEVRDLAGRAGGGVSAFTIEPGTGALSALNTQPTPVMPCHCAVDRTGRLLLVATFGGGSVHLFPIEQDGRIGPECDAHYHTGSSIHPRRQTEPHAHAVALDPTNRFVLVPDLGTDKVMVYELDLSGARLIPRGDQTIILPPGSGPRHVAFAQDGRFAYLINEMNATIVAFAFDGVTGQLSSLQTVDLLPDGFTGLRSGAAIAVHPRLPYLYATTRSHGSSGMPAQPGLDRLVWFAIDPDNGTLSPGGSAPSGGQIPRSFAFDQSGEWLFVGHQRSGTVIPHRIDPITGAATIENDALVTPVPVCLALAMPTTAKQNKSAEAL